MQTKAISTTEAAAWAVLSVGITILFVSAFQKSPTLGLLSIVTIGGLYIAMDCIADREGLQ